MFSKIYFGYFICFFNYNKAYGVIENNTTFDTAYPFGYWFMNPSGTTLMKDGVTDAYYKFTINKNDKVFIKLGFNPEYLNSGFSIQLFRYDRVEETGLKSDMKNSNTNYPFIYDKLNEKTFFIKVSRTNPNGITIFSIGIDERIKSSSGTYSFTGTVSNLGSQDIYNPRYVESSTISINLRENRYS